MEDYGSDTSDYVPDTEYYIPPDTYDYTYDPYYGDLGATDVAPGYGADGTYSQAGDSQYASEQLGITPEEIAKLVEQYPDTSTTGGTTSGAFTSALSSLPKTIFDALKSRYTSASGEVNWANLAKDALVAGSAYSAYKQASAPTPKTGYQGGIPQFTAVREQLTPMAMPRPGAGSQRYFSDTSYATAAGLPAAQTAMATQATGLEAQNVARAQQIAQNTPPPPTPAAQQAAADKFFGRAPQAMASGGIAGLKKGTYLRGSTDGMADKLDTTIDNKQAAKLSHGEFVIPADVVSHLGNGNSDAGADRLYAMMDKIRKARTGTKKQGKKINPDKFMPGGLAQAYAAGGSVRHFEGGGATGAASGVTGTESNLSNWAGPYVTNMLAKGEALSTQPYAAYQGPLTAGASPLQQQAFGNAANLATPASIGQAAQTAGQVGTAMGGLSYAPATATNQFTAPAAYSGLQAANQFNAPGAYDALQATSQYKAPTPYETGTFTGGKFGTQQAQQYMNPYLQASLDPQLAEARRQADITRVQQQGQMTQQGAFGGSRQAVLQAEGNKNMAANMANITGQGYNTAFAQAQQQFNADQARQAAMQQATEQSRQFGAGQAMTSAQQAAQFGQAAQQANIGQQQFGAGQAMTGAQQAAQFGQAAQQANIGQQQFGAGQAMTAAQQAAQYGQAAQAATEASRQFGAGFGLQGLQGQLSAAQAQGQLGATQNAAGLANLQQQLAAGTQQRDIASQGIAAEQAAFNAERDNPYKMVQFQQSLLQGLPLAAQSYSITNNPYTAAAGAASAVNTLLTPPKAP